MATYHSDPRINAIVARIKEQQKTGWGKKPPSPTPTSPAYSGGTGGRGQPISEIITYKAPEPVKTVIPVKRSEPVQTYYNPVTGERGVRDYVSKVDYPTPTTTPAQQPVVEQPTPDASSQIDGSILQRINEMKEAIHTKDKPFYHPDLVQCEEDMDEVIFN